MKIIYLIFMYSVMLISSIACADNLALLTPGTMTMFESKPGEKRKVGEYLALHRIGEKFFISKTTVFQISIDGEFAELESKIDNVIVYIQGNTIQVGEALTAYSGVSEDPNGKAVGVLVSGSPVKLELGTDVYFIGQGGSFAGPEGRSAIRLSTWTLWDFFITWAGDMDHDGRLDLIVSATDEKSGIECLLLSSVAKKPNHIGEAACAPQF